MGMSSTALSPTSSRFLTAPEFARLAQAPHEVQWFANLDSAQTRRAFMAFVGITAAMTSCPSQSSKVLGLIPFIGQQCTCTDVLHEGHGLGDVCCLPSRQNNAHRQTQLIGQCVYLATKTASRTAQRLCARMAPLLSSPTGKCKEAMTGICINNAMSSNACSAN